MSLLTSVLTPSQNLIEADAQWDPEVIFANTASDFRKWKLAAAAMAEGKRDSSEKQLRT